MRPAARLQAAIEIVDQVIAATQANGAAADTLIARYFKARRYAGSKDRRAIRELVYSAIRRYKTAPQNGRVAFIGLTEDQADLSEQFDGSDYGPPKIGKNETGPPLTEFPDWLENAFSKKLNQKDIDSLSGRAPLNLRVNLSHVTRDDVVTEMPDADAGKLTARSVRMPLGFNVESHPLWQSGAVDIQDEGSQVIVGACAATPGQTIVDLCAGAGGKTLALADYMDNTGTLIACDTDRRRLSKLEPRAKRCGFDMIETRLLNPKQEAAELSDMQEKADCVLVDAPCSGTGTWRRNPEARWRITPEHVARYVETQRHILSYAADLVAPGGFLVYAVCSLLHDEGEGQISSFLHNHSGFRKVAPANEVGVPAMDGYLLTPARHGTDGFFFARLQKS